MPWHTSACGTVFDMTHYNNICGYSAKEASVWPPPPTAAMPASWYDPPNPDRAHWPDEHIASMVLLTEEEIAHARVEAHERADARERAARQAREALGGPVNMLNNTERAALWFAKKGGE